MSNDKHQHTICSSHRYDVATAHRVVRAEVFSCSQREETSGQVDLVFCIGVLYDCN